MPSVLFAAVSLSAGRATLVALAGLGAGIVNGVAGGGTLVSFPALLGLGYPALTANMTSTVGIWPGYVGTATGFREEVSTQRDRILWLLPATVVGAVAGATLLLTTSQRLFAKLAPWLILAATVLFALQPVLRRLLGNVSTEHPTRKLLAHGGTFVTSLYGGYFGAGMGVVMLAVFGVALPDTITRTSGLRAALSLVVNALAAVIFIVRGQLAWEAVGLLAIGALIGGWLGSTAARRVPAVLLRVVIIGVGAATAAKLLAG